MKPDLILVADDDPAVRKVVRAVLEASGYSVLSAENGTQALEIFHQQTELRVLITDIEMPEPDGAQLPRIIKNERPGFPVLVMSGVTPLDGFPILKKPFRASDLVSAVKELLGAGSAHPQ